MKFMPNKLYYKIREVCEIVGLEAHVLRFWETEFPSLAPPKSKKGQRIYRSSDIEMILEIRKLLYEDGYTIAGARKHMGISSAVTAKRRTQGKELQHSTNELQKPSSTEFLPFINFARDEVKAINRSVADIDSMKANDVSKPEFGELQERRPVSGRLVEVPKPENTKASPKPGADVYTPDSEKLKRVQKELENILTLLDRE